MPTEAAALVTLVESDYLVRYDTTLLLTSVNTQPQIDSLHFCRAYHTRGSIPKRKKRLTLDELLNRSYTCTSQLKDKYSQNVRGKGLHIRGCRIALRKEGYIHGHPRQGLRRNSFRRRASVSLNPILRGRPYCRLASPLLDFWRLQSESMAEFEKSERSEESLRTSWCEAVLVNLRLLV
jgi:hypothetical protein